MKLTNSVCMAHTSTSFISDQSISDLFIITSVVYLQTLTDSLPGYGYRK